MRRSAGRVAVLGLGYIGLPTAVVLATRGVEVIGVDINEETVDAVTHGEVPFVEPDLAVAVSGAVGMGTLKATTTTPEADAYIIAVPTPFQPDHTADLRLHPGGRRRNRTLLRGGEVIILESTSPPGLRSRSVSGSVSCVPTSACRTYPTRSRTCTSPTVPSGCCRAGS